MENIEDFLRELSASPSTGWIANEIDETLSQGVSMNVKDAAEDSSFLELAPSQNLPIKERNKRQKYETSRLFSNEEKIEVILKAFEVVYLDLPAIRNSAIKNLHAFDNKIESIVFSISDEETLEERATHKINFHGIDKEADRYRELYSHFIQELS